MGKCKICGKDLRAAKSGYCSFECLARAQELKHRKTGD